MEGFLTSVIQFLQSGRRRFYIHGDKLRFHRTIRRRRSRKAYESSQGAFDSVGGRRRLLADNESQPQIAITHNLATSLRLFVGCLRLIGGHRRSSEIVSGMPQMGEKSCEQSYNFKFKVWDRDDGCGDA